LAQNTRLKKFNTKFYKTGLKNPKYSIQIYNTSERESFKKEYSIQQFFSSKPDGLGSWDDPSS